MTLTSLLGDLSGKEIDKVFPLLRFYTDGNVDGFSKPWMGYDVGNGNTLTEAYLLLGADAGGDRILVDKGLHGPVLKFSHESDDFETVQLAESLDGFIKICTEIIKSKKLDIKTVGKEAFVGEYNRIRGVISGFNGGETPEFWSGDFVDYEEFWDDDGEYTGP